MKTSPTHHGLIGADQFIADDDGEFPFIRGELRQKLLICLKLALQCLSYSLPLGLA